MIKFIIVISFNGISWKSDTLMSIFEQRLSKMEGEYILITSTRRGALWKF